MRKIVFTEEQMKYIMGEEFTSYLDKEDNGCDFPEDSLDATGNEVITNDPDADEFPTTDKIAASRTRSHPFYRQSTYGTFFESKKKVVKNDKGEIVPEICPECGSKVGLYIKGEPVYLCSNKKCNKYFGTKPFSRYMEKEMEKMDKEIEKKEKKKSINERNHDLDGKTFRLGKNVNNEIDNLAANNTGDKMLQNMSNEKDATANSMYVRRNRLQKMKTEDPQRYERINGKKLEKTISDKLTTITNATKVGKENIQDDNLNKIPDLNDGSGKKSRKTTIYYDVDV